MSFMTNTLKKIILKHIDKSMKNLDNRGSQTIYEFNKFKDWCQRTKTELAKMDRETTREERQAMANRFEEINRKATEYVHVLNSALRVIREMSDAIIQNIK
ncbi:MAG: hypothetical protein HWN65_03695 [Candidatus Helarchaeota archaeon]|nr:hypothetical protein [Candidatus Helarchaeota archaeon]